MSFRAHSVIGPLLTAALLTAAPCSFAQHWTKPTSLDSNGNWTFPQSPPQVGIDDSGNALAVWQHWSSPISFSTHAPGGAWSAAQTISTSGNLYGLQVAANGAATIAGAAGESVFAQDRPAGGAWGAATTIATFPYWGEYALSVPLVIFTGDANGDQAVVWEQMEGGGSPETIMAARRVAGGAWGAPELVISQPSGLHIPLAGATMGPSGDLLVSWETYQIVCVGKNCTHQNFTVYAARELAGTNGWAVSGALSSPISNTYGYYVVPVIDAADQPALAYAAVNQEFVAQAVRQNPGTQRWDAPVAVYSDPNGLSLAGLVAGGRTKASLGVLAYGPSGTAPQVAEIDGSLTMNTWAAPLNLSAADPVGPTQWLAFDGNAKGGRAALWYDADGAVRADWRKDGTAAFGRAVTLLRGGCTGNIGQCFTPGPAGIAINANGDAVAVFQQPVTVGSAWSLYAATTN